MKRYHDSLHIDSRTGFDTTDTIVVVSNTMSGKHADLVAKCACTWNSIPQWRRRNVRKLHIKHLNSLAGFYMPRTDTVNIDPRKADEAFDDMSWLFEHEIAHLNFAHYKLSMVRKWIKCAGFTGSDKPVFKGVVTYWIGGICRSYERLQDAARPIMHENS